MAHAACVHPVLSPLDQMGMTTHELLYFTDQPVAHAAAFRDFQRDRMIEARNAEALRLADKRRRAEIASFLTETADVVRLMTADQ